MCQHVTCLDPPGIRSAPGRRQRAGQIVVEQHQAGLPLAVGSDGGQLQHASCRTPCWQGACHAQLGLSMRMTHQVIHEFKCISYRPHRSTGICSLKCLVEL